jgi:phage tail tape-measure protein
MAQDVAARAKASINRPRNPGDKGGTGGTGRKRGALTEGAVVVTVTATLVAELPAVTGFGETAQVASEGAPVQVNVTAWFKPPSPTTLRVYVADCPGETYAVVGDPESGARVKSGPLPVRATP